MSALKFGFAFVLICASVARAADIDTGGSELDLRRLATASRASYHGRYSEAIAKASEVIATAPGFAAAYFERASYYRDAGRYSEALADAARVEGFHPDASQTAVLRSTIALRQHDPQTALKELTRAAELPPLSFWKQSREGNDNSPGIGFVHVVTQHTLSFRFAYTSIAFEMLGQDKAAADAFAQAMKLDSVTPYYVLATHCFYAAIAGFSEMAELTCGEAITTQNRDIGDYDSLGMAHLKMKAWAKAIDDYNHALYARPDLTVSLYGRGIAKRASGDVAGGDADIAAAKQGEPDIVGIMARMGVGAG